ncbi:MAG: amidohydrolase family protein [Planctomycetota bacterium]
MIRRGARGVLPACACAFLIAQPAVSAPAAPPDDQSEVLVIRAARVYTMTGDPIDQGMVRIRDGKIEAVGKDLAVPAGAKVIERRTGILTPGLIDACCVLNAEIPQMGVQPTYPRPPRSLWLKLGEYAARHPSGEEEDDCDVKASELDPAFASGLSPFVIWSEESSEVTPHRLVIDSVNLLSNDFARLLRGGVTTVYLSADSANVIGARGTIVKTAGALDQRVVRRADAVKVALGADPGRRGHANMLPSGGAPTFYNRRPTTRMGVEWVFRKALYDARRSAAGGALHGADRPPEAALPVLLQMLAGEVPVRVQARMQHDIFTALRLAREFGLKFTLEEATEAYRALPQLKAAGVPVIFGPLYMDPAGWRQIAGEADRPRLNSPRQLAEAGLELALTAQELRDEEGLVRQGMLAARYGLSADAALRAITATPAKLLGLADQAGTLKPGTAADLVVWSDEPLAATSRPILVLIGGRTVLDGDQANR